MPPETAMKPEIISKPWLAPLTMLFVIDKQLCIGSDKASSKSSSQPPENFGLKLVYDVTHNIAKVETHKIDGGEKKVWVHRKGATRAFPPGHPDIPADYRSEGQPVLIPGSMGTSSWILSGSQKAMDLTFGSTAHGAGRMMSRSAAKRQYWGADIKTALEKRGIVVRAASASVLAEEADPAYKNVDLVADVSDKVGIATKVARLVPLAVVKG